MSIEIYSVTPMQAGLKRLSIRASFEGFSQIKSEELEYEFSILTNDCVLEKLTLLPDYFKAVDMFFLDQAVVQDFTFDDLALRQNDADCGPILVEFYLEDGSPLPSNIFKVTSD